MRDYYDIAFRTSFEEIVTNLIHTKKFLVDEKYQKEVIYLYETTNKPNKEFIKSSNKLVEKYCEYLTELDSKRIMNL